MERSVRGLVPLRSLAAFKLDAVQLSNAFLLPWGGIFAAGAV
jgi:hypothetical protein